MHKCLRNQRSAPVPVPSFLHSQNNKALSESPNSNLPFSPSSHLFNPSDHHLPSPMQSLIRILSTSQLLPRLNRLQNSTFLSKRTPYPLRSRQCPAWNHRRHHHRHLLVPRTGGALIHTQRIRAQGSDTLIVAGISQANLGLDQL